MPEAQAVELVVLVATTANNAAASKWTGLVVVVVVVVVVVAAIALATATKRTGTTMPETLRGVVACPCIATPVVDSCSALELSRVVHPAHWVV